MGLTVVWRNPHAIVRRRLWNRVRSEETLSLYIVVRSGDRDSEWEGLPNLEMLEGGKKITNHDAKAQSRA